VGLCLRAKRLGVAALAAFALAGAGSAAAAPTTLVAAGDIACQPNATTPDECRQAATAALVRGLAPTAVAALGDLQYESGTLSEFSSFDSSWGAFKPLIHPAAGNHEYYTSGASGYYDYFNGVGGAFGAAGNRGEGYYSYGLGVWHIVVLNSNCDVVSCAAGSPQEQWLRADLARFRAPCTLAYWHHPLFTSGPNRDDPNDLATYPLWVALQDAGADVVLNGHDHHYERFAPQDALANRDDLAGIREFVVGTGGKSLYAFQRRSPNSEFRDQANFGAIELSLRPTGYDWRFLTTKGGAALDAGTGICHNAPPELGSLALAHPAFAVARVPTALIARTVRPPFGSAMSYVLSKPATVRLDIARLLPGRRSGGRCVAPRRRLARRAACTRAIAQGSLLRQGQTGKNTLFFTGRIGNRALSPGSYRFTVTATTSAKSSRPRMLNFRVIER
jgi:calcineurin-like phosphoesterase family protein